MPTTISSRQFNQDSSGAKKAAATGPVIITDRGQPSHVLLTYSSYQELRNTPAAKAKPFVSLLDALSHPESADIELELPERNEPRMIDLS